MPFSEINVGDQYQNPFHRGWGCIFCVEDKNANEKLIKVQAYGYSNCKPVGNPFWKSNRDSMFSESWRIFNGKTYETR